MAPPCNIVSVRKEKGLERSPCFVHLSVQELFHTTAFLSSSHTPFLRQHTGLLGTQSLSTMRGACPVQGSISPTPRGVCQALVFPQTQQPTLVSDFLLCRCCLNEFMNQGSLYPSGLHPTPACPDSASFLLTGSGLRVQGEPEHHESQQRGEDSHPGNHPSLPQGQTTPG